MLFFPQVSLSSDPNPVPRNLTVRAEKRNWPSQKALLADLAAAKEGPKSVGGGVTDVKM